MRRNTFLIIALLLAAAAHAVEDDSYKLHVYGWSYGRERKTITSSNRVTGSLQIKNVSAKDLSDISISISYTTGLGEKIGEPITKQIGALKAGASQKVNIVGDFIPVFTGYEMTVQYDGKKKEEWLSTSDVGQPLPKNGEPIRGTASLVVLGKEAGPDRSGKFGGAVKVRNEGTIEAKNVRISITFYDAKKLRIKECNEKLGTGILAGGAEESIPFSIAGAPRNYAAYELKVNCEDTSVETALAGGEFTSVEDVEFAKFSFKRDDAKKSDLKVEAQVRNGFKVPADHVKLTLTFFGAKKKELKRFTYELPGSLKPGEIKPVAFTVSELPGYDGFEQAVAYGRTDGPPASSAKKPEAPKFQKTKDLEIIFTDVETNSDQSVTLSGAMRNGKATRIKDVAVTVAFVKADGSTLTSDSTVPGILGSGEEQTFSLTAPGAGGFKNYSFSFKYVELDGKTK